MEVLTRAATRSDWSYWIVSSVEITSAYFMCMSKGLTAPEI